MRTNHTRWNVSWAVLALVVAVWSAMGLAQAPQPPTDGKARTILLVSESGNQVTEIEWHPDLTLGKAVLQRYSGGEWRLIVHLWRGDKSTRYNQKQMMEASVHKQPLQANDVVVIGAVDKERLRRIEGVPAIARALGLPPTAPPGESPSSGRRLTPTINF
jgi:hypothetical protein